MKHLADGLGHAAEHETALQVPHAFGEDEEDAEARAADVVDRAEVDDEVTGAGVDGLADRLLERTAGRRVDPPRRCNDGYAFK